MGPIVVLRPMEPGGIRLWVDNSWDNKCAGSRPVLLWILLERVLGVWSAPRTSAHSWAFGSDMPVEHFRCDRTVWCVRVVCNPATVESEWAPMEMGRSFGGSERAGL